MMLSSTELKVDALPSVLMVLKPAFGGQLAYFEGQSQESRKGIPGSQRMSKN